MWRCESRLTNTGVSCRARTVNEEYLISIVLKAINTILLEKSSYLDILQHNIAMVIQNSKAADVEEINRRLDELQQELIKKANNREAYDDVADEIFRLRDIKEKSDSELQHREEHLRRITDLCDFIHGQPSEITEFDEVLFRRLIGKITVYDDKFTITFKSGVSVDIEE